VLERCEDVFCVLLVPPSIEVQAERLRARGDDEERVRQRLELGRREIEEGRLIADAIVVNDELDQAVSELAAIVDQARLRFRRETPRKDAP
jgi:guanylate kinase